MLKWKIETQKEAIVKERIRLEKEMNERTTLGRHNGYIPPWFPKWLSQSDDDHLKTDTCKKRVKIAGSMWANGLKLNLVFAMSTLVILCFAKSALGICQKNLKKS